MPIKIVSKEEKKITELTVKLVGYTMHTSAQETVESLIKEGIYDPNIIFAYILVNQNSAMIDLIEFIIKVFREIQKEWLKEIEKRMEEIKDLINKTNKNSKEGMAG